ncbi:MAG TPA: FAD-binding oxidoreductase [Candidatus Saccharimonadales bacterium]|nr:FAD-binding oxidoreductase [Candidatus Saccharimonadales bacterium]
MSKVAHYLQEHLMGEVMTSPDARRYFATDASVLSLTPALVVYPRNENDVRKTARFTWQLAERGRVIPITARGAGTDLSGAALGSGIMLAFPAHMHRVLELDSKSGVVTVEPGINYAKLQQTLNTHDRFLPPYPASVEYSTIGGAVANNSSGEKSFKYGDTRDYVRSTRVVLANGEVIETGRLSKRELGKKLGLATFEGEIYRAVDTLLEENSELIGKIQVGVTKNSAGYYLEDIKRKDGSFDLTPLIVGSQGTLGIVTEVTFETEAYIPNTILMAAQFNDLESAQTAVLELRDLPDMPSAIEMVDDQLLTVVDKLNPNQLKDVIAKPFPRVVMLIEFDSASERMQKRLIKKTQKILEKLGATFQIETDPAEQEKLWKIRHASAAVVAHTEGNIKALPIIEDGIVPPERFREYLEGLYAIFDRAHLQAAVWGHAGDAHLHVQPFLDLSQVGDRQKVFKIMDEYYSLVLGLGGSIAGEHGEGRLRAPYLPQQYGPEIYSLFQKVKQIFDPYGTLNPGVKVNVTIDNVKQLLRPGYSLEHLYDHMPRS